MTNSKPETAREALVRWDAGEIVQTAEMGGLGPGYEQCIHIIAFEIIRELLKREPIPWPGATTTKQEEQAWRTLCDSVETAVMPRISYLQCSGAQWGAAQNLAYRVCRAGWAKALSELPEDRLTLVNKHFPK